MTPQYKLSPSDFKYLWEECKHCYYQKVRNGIMPHYGAFPAIFTYMNSLLQNDLMGKNMQEIHPNLPSGIIKYQEGWLRSKPVDGAENCYISGRFDVLIELEDGTHSVIDFKITKPNEEKVEKYSRQLHAYKYALENSDNGDKPVRVSTMGIVTICPDSIAYRERKFIFTTTPQWHPIQTDMPGFLAFVAGVQALLKGDLPEESSECSLCKYRNSFPKREKIEDDLPF